MLMFKSIVPTKMFNKIKYLFCCLLEIVESVKILKLLGLMSRVPTLSLIYVGFNSYLS